MPPKYKTMTAEEKIKELETVRDEIMQSRKIISANIDPHICIITREKAFWVIIDQLQEGIQLLRETISRQKAWDGE